MCLEEAMKSYKFELFADYFQLYLMDACSGLMNLICYL